MRRGIIYKYTSPSGGIYIGQTIDEDRRRSEFNDSNNSYGGIKIDSARKKYGVENFNYEVLFSIEAEEDIIGPILNEMEMKYISLYDSFNHGYNSTIGGNNIGSQFHLSREKQRHSLKEYYKTHNSPRKGAKLTPEEKKIISERQKLYYQTHDSPFKGHTLSKEVRERLSELARKRVGELNPFYGKHHTEETKRIIQKRNSKPVLQIDPNTDEIITEFESAIAACRSFGCKCNDVAKAMKQNRLWHGYKWIYKEKFNDYSERKYNQVIGNGRLLNKDEDIV